MITTDLLPPSVKVLFSTEQTWQSWLDVEAALALTQAELGMIPAHCGQEIAKKANLKNLDLEALRIDISRTMAPVLSVVNALSRVCTDVAAGYVHWGATTQNIIFTGRILQMRKAHNLLLARIGRTLDRLSEMARQGSDVVMVGRTNRKHALPITFGFKVSGWIEELARCIQRLEQVEARAFSLIFGGAIGAMHTFGADGTRLTEALAKRLQLSNPLVHSRSMLDPFCEYVVALSLFGMTCSRIGNELYQLMSEELGEVAEYLPESVVGSSTMPHKNNPKYVVTLIAQAARLRAMAAPALEAGQPSHEGDAACNQQLYALIDDACPLAYDLAVRLEQLLNLLRFDPVRMSHNLSLSSDVIASERLMMVLATKIGRQHAHDKVHAAIRESLKQEVPLAELLIEDPQVNEHFLKTDLVDALDPAQYTGNSHEITGRAANLADSLAYRLRFKSYEVVS